MKSRTLTASGFRMILVICLFIVAGIGIAVFWLTDDYLKGVAVNVSHTTVNANASQSNIQTLQKIQEELANNKTVVERASSIVAESKSYQYQDQIIKDLNDYATRSGISITKLDFSGTTAATGQTTTKPATPNTSTISGVKSVSVNVSLKTPISYTNLLKFIQSIEQNLTKMQISKINLAKDSATGGVTSDAFSIEVYTR